MIRCPFRSALAFLLAILVFICPLPFHVLAADDPQPAATQPVETLPEPSAAPTDPTLTPPESPEEETVSQEDSAPTETAPAETLPEAAITEETAPSVSAAETPSSGPGLYFGLLRSHSSISDGTSPPEAVFQSAAEKTNMDFFCITDFSDSFDNPQAGEIQTDGSITSTDWAAGKSAAAAASSGSFVGIFGYEMGWPAQMKLGHITTFGTPGFRSWMQPEYQNYDGALQNYYHTIASASGSVSAFGHPGREYGTFMDFAYDAAADGAVTMLEVDLNAADPCRYYVSALDAGWHLAPIAGQSIYSSSWTDNGVRTAVYAEALTEAGILDALRSCRAYATQDADLEVYYRMDGHFMGSRLDLRHVGDAMDISVSLHDPTDSIGTIEVLTNGGQTIASQTLSATYGTVTFRIPTASGYYFLKITQPDGQVAITAPIWVNGEEDLGIADLICRTQVPVQYEKTDLTLQLYNGEEVDFLVESLEILANSQVIFTDNSLKKIPRHSNLSHDISFSCENPGRTAIMLRLTGTLEGSQRSFEKSLELSFHQSGQVTGILADGSHGNAGLSRLTILRQLAEKQNIRFAVTEEAPASGMLKDCRFLLITPPAIPFSDQFLSAAADFTAYGGSILICGQSASLDSDIASAAELNRVLHAIGSSIRLRSDTALDFQNNSGIPGSFFPDQINTTLSCCEGISNSQVFCFTDGCTLDAGNGSWILRGLPTTESSDGNAEAPVTLMACESLSGGGNVYASGSLFLSDLYLKEPAGLWDDPTANRTIAGNLLGIGGNPTPLSAIADARAYPDGTLVRIRGYVTAGNSNPHNTFPDTLYLQDDTGGLAVTPFSGSSVQQGTAMEIAGYVATQNGNKILRIADSSTLSSAMYFCPPETGDWDSLLDTAVHGGSLVEVEGTCLEVYCREDGSFAGCLLQDKEGNQAVIKIEDYILNGSDGKNNLHLTIRKDRTVRAMGLLHTDEYGDTVIRARNCEEVAWISPRTYINPRTNDPLPFALVAMSLSFLGLCLLGKRKKA